MNCKYIIQKYEYGGWVDFMKFRSELSSSNYLNILRRDYPKSKFRMLGVFSIDYER